MKTIQKLLWTSYTYSLTDHIILTDELIREAITNFFENKVNKISDKEHIIVMFRVRTNNDHILTIGNLQKIGTNHLESYVQYINDVLYYKNDEYKQEIIKEFIFSYGVRQGVVSDESRFEFKKPIYQSYKNYKIPATFDPKGYGRIITSYTDQAGIPNLLLQVTPLTIAKVKHSEYDRNEVEIIKNGMTVLKYTDYWMDENKFKRVMGNNEATYYFNRSGEFQLFTIMKPTRFIKQKRANKKIDKRAVTLDIETYVNEQNEHVPYVISFYDGEACKSFYVTDYNSSDEMIKASIEALIQPRYNKHKVYIHNLANFDSIFLLRNLVTFGDLNVIMNKGKLISIDLTVNDIEISFRDSYQILLASLKKLGKSFQVDTQKSIFPYNFVNKDNLKYKGNVPDIEYFESADISIDEYNEYVYEYFPGWKDKTTDRMLDKLYNEALINNPSDANFIKEYPDLIDLRLLTKWNLREEAIKYCETDCISLYEIVMKFNELFFDRFNININDHPTLPGLAFRLFRTRYLNDTKIPMIYGDNYKQLKHSYTGGAVDMYIPTNNSNELVYAYDVNSLYPFVMANFPMPVGKINYFEGNIRKYYPDAFGFFYCKITCPKSLQHPILQTHVNTKEGMRTVAGLGTYHDMIFSHSYDLAIKLGYKIEILWGYNFDKQIIFKDYVNDLYKMRLDYSKDDPMNYTAKILLNSLYGKFGMRDNFDIIKVITQEELDKLLNDNSIINDIINLDDHFLIQMKDQDNIVLDDGIGLKKAFNINVCIASAITSYARDYMAQFKNNPNLKLFYTDTDSIYTNLNPEEMNKLFPGIVSNNELGKLKLEGIYRKAIFLAPKCYALEDLDGKLTYKVKGLTKNVKLDIRDFETLLHKDSVLIKNQTKWYKSLSEGTINVLVAYAKSYTLRQSDNKRELIFDNGKVIATKPYIIHENDITPTTVPSKTKFLNYKFIINDSK